MRVVILTRLATDYARAVEMFVTDFFRQTGKQIEVIDADSIEGDDLARTYGIVQYPTVIAVSEEGSMQNMWTGEMLPTISEVSYYVQ